jgi:hypothetical protein
MQAGFKNFVPMRNDPHFNPLRQREDFQMLLVDVDKGK